MGNETKFGETIGEIGYQKKHNEKNEGSNRRNETENFNNDNNNEDKLSEKENLSKEVLNKTVTEPLNEFLDDIAKFSQSEWDAQLALDEINIDNLKNAFFSDKFINEFKPIIKKLTRRNNFYQREAIYNLSAQHYFKAIEKITNDLVKEGLSKGKSAFFDIYTYKTKNLDSLIENNLGIISPEIKEEIVKIIEKKIEDIKNKNYKPISLKDYYSGIILEMINPKMIEFLYKKSDVIRQYMKDGINSHLKHFCIERGPFDPYIDRLLKMGEKTDFPQFIKDRLANLVEERYSINGQIFLDWHSDYGSGSDFLKYIEKSLDIMNKIEQQRKGGVKILFNDFGIKRFLRYPIEVLIAQIDERNIDKPYGIIIYPKYDYNQRSRYAFDSHNHIIRDIFEQLDKKLALRILEVGGKFSLTKALIKLNKTYGSKNKISFMILGGHGEPDSITFGKSDIGEITSSDIRNAQYKTVERIKSFFIKKPSVVLFSCSTGEKEKGKLGQQLSQTFESIVEAPEEDSFIKKVKVNFTDDGQPIFEVIYGTSKNPDKNVGVTYNKGKID